MVRRCSFDGFRVLEQKYLVKLGRYSMKSGTTNRWSGSLKPFRLRSSLLAAAQLGR